MVGLQGIASGLQGRVAGKQLNGLQSVLGSQATFGGHNPGLHLAGICLFLSVTSRISIDISFHLLSSRGIYVIGSCS